MACGRKKRRLTTPDVTTYQCPKHKSTYVPDGTFLSGRATRNMERFALRKDGSTILVDTDRMYEQDKHPQEWSAAVVVV